MSKTKTFFVISPTKLGGFWWHLVHRFLNKFAQKWCKRFPPLLNSVSTLPRETSNAHCAHATVELLYKETPEFIPSQLWPPNSPDLNPVNKSMWEMLQEKLYKTLINHHWSGVINDATDKWLPQWRHSPALGLIGQLCSQSLFHFVQVTDTCFVHLLLQ